MSVIGRSTFAPVIAPNLRRLYLETGKRRPMEYDKLLNVVEMQWNPETDQQMTGLGTMPSKPEGTNFLRDSPLLGSSNAFLAVPYGLAVEFTFEFWQDELYTVAQRLAAELAVASNTRQEVQAASVYNNAFSTSFPGFTAAEALCSTSHALIDGSGTVANRPDPDIQLSQTALQSSLTTFENMEDERGHKRLLTPTTLTIPPALKFTAREILGSMGKTGTADNEINAVVDDDLMVYVYHYLTSATAWFLQAAKDGHDLQFRWRTRPIFDAFDDPNSKNAILTSYQRHTEGWSSYRGFYGSTG